MIRPATEADFDRIIGMARAVYADDFDEQATRQWGLEALRSPKVLIAVGERGFGVAGVSAPFYAPRRLRGIMMFLASTGAAGYEPCAILRYMVTWAKERGAVSFAFGEETGVNLEPLARRVGASKDRDSYVIRF